MYTRILLTFDFVSVLYDQNIRSAILIWCITWDGVHLEYSVGSSLRVLCQTTCNAYNSWAQVCTACILLWHTCKPCKVHVTVRYNDKSVHRIPLTPAYVNLCSTEVVIHCVRPTAHDFCSFCSLLSSLLCSPSLSSFWFTFKSFTIILFSFFFMLFIF